MGAEHLQLLSLNFQHASIEDVGLLHVAPEDQPQVLSQWREALEGGSYGYFVVWPLRYESGFGDLRDNQERPPQRITHNCDDGAAGAPEFIGLAAPAEGGTP